MSRDRSSHLPSIFSIQLNGERGSFLVSRPGPAVVCIRVGGHSVEDLTDALTQELEPDLVIQGALTLFIDARARGAEILGSPRWALWFRSHRAQLARVVVLVASDFMKSTGDLARGFAGLDTKLEVILEPAAFERERTAALRSPIVSGTWDRVDVARVDVARVDVARVDVARVDPERIDVARVDVAPPALEPVALDEG